MSKSTTIHSSVKQLLQLFYDRGIRYCHFKSNEHLEPAVEGVTDLDILLEPNDFKQVIECLTKSGFKPSRSNGGFSYLCVEDWFGLDESSGVISHIHLHWSLILGEPNLKSFSIPWGARILAARVLDDRYGIFTSSHEFELLLLVIRLPLKLRIRDFIRSLRKYHLWSASAEKERLWLVNRVDKKLYEQLCSDFLLGVDPKLLDDFYQGTITKVNFIRLRWSILRCMSIHRTMSSFSALTCRWYSELCKKIVKPFLNRAGLYLGNRRCFSTGGRIIAFVGSDGAGKSTQKEKLVESFNKKFQVTSFYLGSGSSGKASLFRRLFQLPYKFHIRYFSEKDVGQVGGSTTKTEAFFLMLFALSLAFEKKSKLKKIVRARNRGMIVICDRYPQFDVEGINDGLHLARFATQGGILSWAAALERKLLQGFIQISVDLLLKLKVDPVVARERLGLGPDQEQNIAYKISCLDRVSWKGVKQTKTIDSNSQIEKVRLGILKEVWGIF
jgi:thymidylate kinase